MGVHIKAVVDGFRRGGIAHSAKGTYYPTGYFTEDQLEQFRQEPNLLVTEVAVNDLPSGQDDQLIQELGGTIAQLEHDLGRERAGLSSAVSTLTAVLDNQAKVPSQVLDAARLLEPAAPGEGVISIKEEVLAEIIGQYLKETRSDASQSTLDNPGGPDTPPEPAPVTTVPTATGTDATVKPEKPANKRGAADKKGTGE
ncbi:HI1506-related protein [Pseudomonas sp. Irchel 3E13]|uniref:HI1506-related protein n=1 Tax=Pseudomonas sp. Irchel 3E13 TaxID=2008975 RepID=UPI000BA31DEC|nr:HI1506-related protein [Pseudomonas sp. Irchel 3E13]